MKAGTIMGLMLLLLTRASFPSPPLNDNFANRLPVSTNSVITNAAWSTIEPGEPTHSTNFTAGSIWWTWTPTNTGTYRIQTIVTNSRSALAIYTGTDLTNLTLASHAESPFFYSEGVLIDFHAVAGVDYSIAATYLSVDETPLRLEIHIPPAHDSFSAALTLTLNEPRTDTFVVATLEPGESSQLTSYGTLWYMWTAPASGPFVFVENVEPIKADRSLVFTGSELTNLSAVRALHYSPGSTNAAAFRAEQGTTYRFSVPIWSYTPEKTITARVIPGHPHDALTNAAPLSGLFLAWTNTVFSATTEPGEELISTFTYLGSVWAKWTASESRTFKIVSLFGGIEVYRGGTFADFVKVGGTLNRVISFTAEAGVTYHFRATASSRSPDFVLRLGPATPNESPETATEITGANISITGQNWTASNLSQGHPMIWYKWTAPNHGLIAYQNGTNSSTIAYHGRIPTIGSNLAFSVSSPRPAYVATNVAVTAGVTYYFGISTSPSTNVPFTLNFQEKPAALGDLAGALLGGNAHWSLQPNTFFSAPTALQAGPLQPFQSAFIELVIYGPGTVTFRTKINGTGGAMTLATGNALSGITSINEYSGNHPWTQRGVTLSSDFTVLRWTMFSTGSSASATATGWIDDLVFTSRPPTPPNLSIRLLPWGSPSVGLPPQAGRITTLDTSTNLLQWVPYTNFPSVTAVTRYFQFPPPTNDTPQFFRARVMP